jgi:hypothetical protein
MSYLQPVQQVQPVQNPPKQVSLETIKRRLKKLDTQEFPVLFTYGDINLYWFHSPRKYSTMTNTLELLQNLREFFALDLDKKQLNKYYEIHKELIDYGNGIVTSYRGSYDMGFASGTMSFGIGLDHNAMIAKIDDYIAKYHN